jgi:hypothetical protein
MQALTRKRLIAGLAAGYGLVLLGIILLAGRGSMNPVFAFVQRTPYLDKLGHFLLIGLLALLVNLALGARRWQVGGQRVLLGSAVVAALVTLEELSQLFLPNRAFSLLDLAANYAGIWVFGWLAGWLVRAVSLE